MNCWEKIAFQVGQVWPVLFLKIGETTLALCIFYISDQLMYLPPMGTLPENQEDPNVPLKKILLWNGASSWGGMKAGRGIFLKEKCPVSTCVLSTARAEAESADLVLFKDHFTMPYFKRPLSQIWMLYLLGLLTSSKKLNITLYHRMPPPYPDIQAGEHLQLDRHLPH